MNLLRRLLLVLLVISLPRYGWAGNVMPACPMQQPCSMQMQAQQGTATPLRSIANNTANKTQGDHCGVRQHADKSAPACQDGMQCQCGALYQTAQPLTAQVIPASHTAIQFSPFHLIATAVPPLWRPPTAS